MECEELLVQNPNYGIQFFKRQANDVSHPLVKGATFHARLKVYHHIPTFIFHAIINEMTWFSFVRKSFLTGFLFF